MNATKEQWDGFLKALKDNPEYAALEAEHAAIIKPLQNKPISQQLTEFTRKWEVIDRMNVIYLHTKSELGLDKPYIPDEKEIGE